MAFINPITGEPVSVTTKEYIGEGEGGRFIIVQGARFLPLTAVADFADFNLWELELMEYKPNKVIFFYHY